MKRFFLAIFTFVMLLPIARATEFERVDSTLTESTRIMAATIQKKANWQEEKARLLALLNSYEALLKSKKDALKKLQAENSKIESKIKSVSDKILADDIALAEFSKSLDSYFANLQQNKIALQILKDNSFDVDAFLTKSVPEKISFLCRAYAKLFEVDTNVDSNHTGVSTGVFTTATGQKTGDIAVLKLKGDRK